MPHGFLKGTDLMNDDERNRNYAEQLEAHMDAGGKYKEANVRDLIRMILSRPVVEKDTS